MVLHRISQLVAGLSLCAVTACAASNPTSSQLNQLDSVIDNALTTFHTPGMSVGVIHNGKVLYAKGRGYRHLNNKQPVNADTLFRLASTSKAFTAAALALAIDEFDLSWKTRVTDILPEFQMQDPWVTREFTLLDLLTHRSGLGGGAGDSMLWPEPSGFSRTEIIHNLRYLTPVSSFRSEYAYSNVMYITAGEVVAALYQKPYAQVIQEKFFTPLDMQCFAGDLTDAALNNVAMSYGHNDERGIYAIPRNSIDGRELVSAAAGGIVCNANDMLKWLQMWLDNGLSADGQPILTPAQIESLQQAYTVLPVSDTDEEWDGTLFKSYALGWRLSDVSGIKVISHTGTLSGYQAYVALVPELNLAVAVLNNGSNYGARGAVMQHILKSFISPSDKQDWVQRYVDYQDEREQRYLANFAPPTGSGEVILDPIAYAGEFADTWFGTLSITTKADALRIASEKMPMLTGTLEPFEDHTFVIRWDNQNAASDAFIHFDVNTQRQVTGFSLYPFTNKTRENHEYRDMYFTAKDSEN